MDSREVRVYLEKLSDVLAKKEIKGEIVLYGGAAMVTAFNARPSTKDVDAVFSPKEEIYAAAKEIEERYDIPENWLNDAVKGFLSTQGEVEPFMDLPCLKVYIAKPQYMVAMKCMSLRLGRGEKDLEDI